MSRKNRSREEKERRAKIRELLQTANIGSMEDIQKLFKETIAKFMENGLEAELEEDLGYSKYDYRNKDTENSRNGYSGKTLKTSFGDVEVSVPRDRKGEVEPQLLKKNQTSISQDIEEKILSMYAKGMTTADIEAHIQDIYGLAVSDTTVSRITDKILPIAKEWQQRPLEPIYAVVFLDAIHNQARQKILCKRISTNSRISHLQCAGLGLIPLVHYSPGRLGRYARRLRCECRPGLPGTLIQGDQPTFRSANRICS